METAVPPGQIERIRNMGISAPFIVLYKTILLTTEPGPGGRRAGRTGLVREPAIEQMVPAVIKAGYH